MLFAEIQDKPVVTTQGRADQSLCVATLVLPLAVLGGDDGGTCSKAASQFGQLIGADGLTLDCIRKVRRK